MRGVVFVQIALRYLRRFDDDDLPAYGIDLYIVREIARPHAAAVQDERVVVVKFIRRAP
jgi:hypothetical protein